MGDVMGLYQRMSSDYNKAPAYRQLNTVTRTQPAYLYKADFGYWLAGLKLGGSGAGLQNTNRSPAPPRSGWQYYNGSGWHTDRLLSVVSISDTTDLICTLVNISATGAAARRVPPDYLGQYRITEDYSAGRPIYKNSRNKYLYVPGRKVTWHVGDTAGITRGWI